MAGSTELAAALAGLLFGLSLIVAIGPQNAFVLRQGVSGRHAPTVVALCSASDAALIAAGVAGAGAALAGRAWLEPALRILGAAFLLGYAALAAHRAISPPPAPIEPRQGAGASRAAVAAATLAFTWLNPAVYVDTLVLVGSVANSHPGRQWWFAAGAVFASCAWFAALGFGSRLLAPVFRHRRAWQALDVFVAAVMAATAARLLADL